MQLSQDAGGGWVLRGAVSIPRLEPGAELSVREAERVMGVLERRGFEGRRVVVTPADRSVHSALLELPPATSGAPVDQIAAMEVGTSLKREPGTFEMAYWAIPSPPRGSGGVHARAVACPHASSMELLSVLESVGAEVVAIDVRAWALARAFAASPAQLTAVVELGWASGRLVLLHGGSVAYERILEEWSLRSLFDAMANVLEIDAGSVRALLDSPEFFRPNEDRRSGAGPLSAARRCMTTAVESLAKEIEVSFRYIAHRFPGESGAGEVGAVHVCGPGASLANLPSDLGEKLGVKTALATPATLVRLPEHGAVDRGGASGPELVAALGLAMWKDVDA